MCVCVWRLRCLDCVQKFHWLKLRNEEQRKAAQLQMIFLAVWKKEGGRKFKKKKKKQGGKKEACEEWKHAYTLSCPDQQVSWMKSGPHSYLTACALSVLHGGSPDLSVSLLFSDWESTTQWRPVTYATRTKFIIKVCSITLLWNPL